jgi:hypothetical protein
LSAGQYTTISLIFFFKGESSREWSGKLWRLFHMFQNCSVFSSVNYNLRLRVWKRHVWLENFCWYLRFPWGSLLWRDICIRDKTILHNQASAGGIVLTTAILHDVFYLLFAW